MPIKFIDEIDSDSSVTAESFIKIGGTSSQFLKADGSVDSSTYQSTLISGTNIKTINGSTILGNGNLVISTSVSWGSITGTLSSQTDLNTALDNTTLIQTSVYSGVHILTLSDRDTNIENNNDLTIEIPLNSSVAFPIGTQIFFTKKAETITFKAAGTVVNSVDNLLKMGRINCGASLLKIGTDEWNLIGELV